MADYNGKSGYKTCNQEGDAILQMEIVNESGEVHWRTMKIKNIYYVPGLTTNLLSVNQLMRQGHLTAITKTAIRVYNKKNKEVLTATVTNGVYQAVSQRSDQPPAAFFVGQEKDTEENWHRRLGHLNYGHIRQTINKSCATGIRITKRKRDKTGSCEVCQIGKICRAKIPKQATRTPEEKSKVGSVDCVGPLKPLSYHQHKYIFFHTYQNYVEINFGSTKDQAKKYLKAWVERIERQHGPHALHTIRSDNGGEYQNEEIITY